MADPTATTAINSVQQRTYSNQMVHLGTTMPDWQWTLAAASPATAYTYPPGSQVAQPPATASVIAFPTPAGSHILIAPFGTNAENEDFGMRVMGHAKQSTGWFGINLWEGLCVMGASPGLASTDPVDNSQFLCDTVTQTDGVDQTVENSILLGSLVHLDHLGFPWITIDFKVDAGSSTAYNANALVRSI